MAFEARILGPVEAARDGRSVPLGSPKQKAVFALLVLDAGRVVSTDRLVDELWGERPPESPSSSLQVYISRLRRSLRIDAAGPDDAGEEVRLRRRGAGYQLDIPDRSVDADLFADLVAGGRTMLADRPADARQVLEEALALPRGPALADVVSSLGPSGAAEAQRLDDLRLLAQQARLEALLAQGDAVTAAADAAALVQEHPLREGLHEALMLALYRSGRQSEALAAYDSVRRELARSLGMDPGAALRDLHARILRHDPALEPVVNLRTAPAAVPAAADRQTSPPAGSARATGSRLPEPLTSFVGREADVDEVVRSVRRSRLTSLVGTGGAGKTRLALAAARATGAVYWVDVAVLEDPAVVPHVVGLALAGHEATDGSPLDAAIDHLGDRDALLVLDNCEHLVAACADVVQRLLAGCPGLRALVTSREPLGVPGEVIWPVHPLTLPPAGLPLAPADAVRSAAVRLWCDRAAAALRGFTLDDGTVATVVRICRRLDGLPLAIELAAARLRVLSLEEIADALDRRLAVLVAQDRGQPARHRTLYATLDWSFRLLTAEERRLLAELSVFHGGFTLDAVSAVRAPAADGERRSSLDLVSALIDRSLVMVADRGRPTRYRLLETVRLFAAEHLPAEESRAVEDRHLAYFGRLAGTAEARLTGPAQQEWLDLLDADIANLIGALRWSVGAGAAPEAGLRLVSALWRFWYLRGHYSAGREWLDAALAAAVTAPEALRAKALAAGGRFAYLQGDYAVAEQRLEQALAGYRSQADTAGIAYVQQSLGSVARERGDYPRSRVLHRESRRLWRAEDRPDEVARSSNYLAFVAWLDEEWDEALRECGQALEFFSSAADGEGSTWSLIVRGAVAAARGDLATARAQLEEAQRHSASTGYREGVAWSLNLLGVVALRSDEPATARGLLSESLRAHWELGDRWRTASVLVALAAAEHELGDSPRAGRLLGAAEALRLRLAVPVPKVERRDLATVTAALSATLGAARLAAVAETGAGTRLEQTVQQALSRSVHPGDEVP
jgi:predicted ATPase/DNA-binding SARP family transcriptional activator